MSVLSKATKHHSFYNQAGKRILDFSLSFVGILLLLPIYLLIAVVIKLDSKGPAIYRQKRIGKDKREFEIYKFRSMVVNADKIGGLSTKQGDPRITKVGKFLRKTSLDEIPQLFNVLLGDMSFVGPRPDVKESLKNYDEDRMAKFLVKPGITGYAQVYGRSSLTVDKKKELEVKYVEEVSLSTDIKVLIKTAKKVILTDNSF